MMSKQWTLLMNHCDIFLKDLNKKYLGILKINYNGPSKDGPPEGTDKNKTVNKNDRQRRQKSNITIFTTK